MSDETIGQTAKVGVSSGEIGELMGNSSEQTRWDVVTSLSN